jgi:peptidoglycan/xylan/chitin deacetylase (PgdA/CDA1 family)
MTDRAENRREWLTAGPGWVSLTKATLTRARSLFWLLRIHRQRSESGVRILFYHRVSDEPDALAVKVRRFREQMDYLARAGYHVIDIEEAMTMLASGGLDERVIALSFDDGYRDVAENALPILVERGFTATVFVATGVVDGIASFTWYKRQPPLLDWNAIEELDGLATLRFEAHSVTHPNLLELDATELWNEVANSKLDLERHLGRPSLVFCYPAGLLGARERDAVAKAGFRIAVTCEPGVNRRDGDPFALRRIPIEAHDRLLDFRAKVGGGHDTSSLARNLYRRLRYRGKESIPRATSKDE